MLSRSITTKIAFILDELVPPLLRDARWFMWIPFRMLLGNKSDAFFAFKDDAFDMSYEQIQKTYRDTESAHIKRETDLNPACVERILANVKGENVLEVGCGRGYLANQLAQHRQVTACDMIIPDSLREKYPQLALHESPIENLPFEDNSFDTVVSTHTLEHIPDIVRAIAELRRVARKRLIIVVPKQRPYRYTFDLHVHFFPYRWSLLAFMATESHPRQIELVSGDWYCQEEIER